MGFTRLGTALCVVLSLGMIGAISAQAKAKAKAKTPPGVERLAQRAISDCARDGDLDRRYSTRVLLRAVEVLPSDVDEYTNCRSVINSALNARSRR